MIVLMTDFGSKDPYTGIMKGVIKQISPSADIIDLIHEIPSYNVAIAYFLLKHSYVHFPEQTIFVAVVDPGVGTSRKPIAIRTEHYYFVGPDNGIFGFLSEPKMAESMAIIQLNKTQYYYREKTCHTFHGRDIFAPAAAHLDQGIDFFKLGERIDSIQSVSLPRWGKRPKGIDIPLIHIDHFGNLIFSITKEEFLAFTKKKRFSLMFKGHTINSISKCYESEKPFIALFNSYNLLEITAPSYSAAIQMQVSRNDFLHIALL